MILPAVSHHPSVRSKSHLISITNDTFITLNTENSKGFRNSVPENEKKTKYIFIILKSQHHCSLSHLGSIFTASVSRSPPHQVFHPLPCPSGTEPDCPDCHQSIRWPQQAGSLEVIQHVSLMDPTGLTQRFSCCTTENIPSCYSAAS